MSWRGGERLLTIIDEALANVVDESSATTENLAFVIGLIPPAVRAALPEQVALLNRCICGSSNVDPEDVEAPCR